MGSSTSRVLLRQPLSSQYLEYGGIFPDKCICFFNICMWSVAIHSWRRRAILLRASHLISQCLDSVTNVEIVPICSSCVYSYALVGIGKERSYINTEMELYDPFMFAYVGLPDTAERRWAIPLLVSHFISYCLPTSRTLHSKDDAWRRKNNKIILINTRTWYKGTQLTHDASEENWGLTQEGDDQQNREQMRH